MELAEIEMLVGELELRVDRLRALYDQYFMGIEKLEPMVPRKDVERRFQTLRKEQIRNTAVRFKFQTILQRYNTYQTYWMRICRQIEEGTYRRDVMRAHRRFGNDAVKGSKRASERPRAAEASEGAREGGEVGTSPLPPRPVTPLPVEVDLLRNLQPDGALDIDVEWSGVTEDPFPKPPPSQQTPHPIAESRPRTMRIAPLGSLPPGMMPTFGPRPAGAPGDMERRISVAPRGRLPSSSGEDPRIIVARRSATIVPEGGVSIAPPRGLTMLPESPSLPPARGASVPPPVPRPNAVPPVAPPLPPRPSMGAPTVPPRAPAAAGPPPSPAAQAQPTIASMPPGGRTVSPPRPPASATALPPPVPSRAPAAPPASAAAAPASRGDIAEDRVRQLYSQYIDTKRRHNESTAAITYEGLAASLRQSSEKLREKHGKSRSVDFEVIVKDGKTILRPIVK